MLIPNDQQWYRPVGAGDFGYEAPDKGRWQGSCNRSCCQFPKAADWYHQDNQRFYCFECAHLINEFCPTDDLKRLGCKSTRALVIPPSDQAHPHYESNAALTWVCTDIQHHPRHWRVLVMSGITGNDAWIFAQHGDDTPAGTEQLVLDLVEKWNPPERVAWEASRTPAVRKEFLYAGKKRFSKKDIS